MNELRSFFPPPYYTPIAGGTAHTALVTPDGKLYMCGDNSMGQLGTGDRINYSLPIQIQFPLPVIAVACGNSHTAVVTISGDLYTWGANTYGQLGRRGEPQEYLIPGKVNLSYPCSRVVKVAAGGSHTAVITIDGGLYVCGLGTDNQLGNGRKGNHFAFIQVRLPPVRTVACGFRHTVAVTLDYKLYVWG